MAEERKKAGNEAYGKKDYETAIKFYTEAIELDPQNHIYYSNRSLCYAETKKLDEAKADADLCIKIEPSFVKGYHRLANALFLAGKLDEATAAVRQGLQKDSNMTELNKLLRKIKAKKAALQSRRSPAQIDESTRKEIHELSEQYQQTGHDLNEVRARLEACEKEQRRLSLTSSEVDSFSEDTPLYQAVGKMFLLSSRANIKKSLQESAELQEKRQTDLKSRQQYLERRLNSQAENMKDIMQAVQAA